MKTTTTDLPAETIRDTVAPGGGIGAESVESLSNEMRSLLADVFTLYLKTKNFHWHMTGRHFRDYHLLLDEQAEQLFAMTDEVAERARKLGGTTLRSVGDISAYQRLKDNNEALVAPGKMLSELHAENRLFLRYLRSTHEACEQHRDVATASLIENGIDQSERRIWFLSETCRGL